VSEIRRRVMQSVGRIIDPLAATIGVRPEALAPNLSWSLLGRSTVRAAIERYEPDVVVATSPPPAALFAAGAVASSIGVPWVADLRDNWAGHPAYDRGGQLLRRAEARALRSAAAVVCVTDGMADRLLELHPWLSGRLHVLPNGFPPSLLSMRRDRDDSRERVSFIHAGALFADRSARELIAAASDSRLRDRVQLVIHGNVDAASERAIEQADRSLEIEIVPPLDWDASLARVAQADVAVVIVPPGIGDDVALPVKLFEALALGLPVLCLSDGGGAEQLLRELGQGIGCARYDEVGAITEAMLRLIDSPPPPLTAEALASWNRATVTIDYVELLESVRSSSR
jgi:glycosyltransferase involved in cell wall biosynthesis